MPMGKVELFFKSIIINNDTLEYVNIQQNEH